MTSCAPVMAFLVALTPHFQAAFRALVLVVDFFHGMVRSNLLPLAAWTTALSSVPHCEDDVTVVVRVDALHFGKTNPRL